LLRDVTVDNSGTNIYNIYSLGPLHISHRKSLNADSCWTIFSNAAWFLHAPSVLGLSGNVCWMWLYSAAQPNVKGSARISFHVCLLYQNVPLFVFFRSSFLRDCNPITLREEDARIILPRRFECLDDECVGQSHPHLRVTSPPQYRTIPRQSPLAAFHSLSSRHERNWCRKSLSFRFILGQKTC